LHFAVLRLLPLFVALLPNIMMSRISRHVHDMFVLMNVY